ncbi:unnamed protein product, partial [marine sediment metagenome]
INLYSMYIYTVPNFFGFTFFSIIYLNDIAYLIALCINC